MKLPVGLCLSVTATVSLYLVPPVSAADLPAIKVTDTNAVPECATPGRLMAYLKSRNSKLDERYASVPVEYMRHGENLNVRWDFAFFQMIVETGTLSYTGDVKPDQNNFAGLGAIGRGAPGESFKDVSSGVRAHLEHVLMYSGEKIVSPVAERTRNIQEWGVLTTWQKSIDGPLTYAHLAKQWAPKTRGYARDIEVIADRFYDGLCKDADPQPELVAAARQGRTPPAIETAAVPAPQSQGVLLAHKALEDARASTGEATRSSLGAAEIAQATAKLSEARSVPVGPQVKILNKATEAPAAPQAPATPHAQTSPQALAKPETQPPIQTAALTTVPAKTAPPAAKEAKPKVAAEPEKKSAGAGPANASPKSSGKCRVWTASYGGTKAIVIKATAGESTNYTVLDVNEGTAKREADAYIAAYAKGGQTVGEFTDQTEALDKAFTLCPEG